MEEKEWIWGRKDLKEKKKRREKNGCVNGGDCDCDFLLGFWWVIVLQDDKGKGLKGKGKKLQRRGKKEMFFCRL